MRVQNEGAVLYTPVESPPKRKRMSSSLQLLPGAVEKDQDGWIVLPERSKKKRRGSHPSDLRKNFLGELQSEPLALHF